ncbi:MAG: hypothetical protein ACI8T1_002312, partial [Verrucomicrobiales bacterium]
SQASIFRPMRGPKLSKAQLDIEPEDIGNVSYLF